MSLSLAATSMLLAQPAGSAAAGSPAPAEATPDSAALIRIGYLALVRDSIVPADPHVVATAALSALKKIAPERVQPLPPDFGHDAKRDADWLAARVAPLPPPWAVLDAMGRAAATVHTSLGTPARRRGIRALMSGDPLVSPGFNVYPDASSRLVIFDVIKGASAENSGIREGDVLVSVNQQPAALIDPFFLATELPGSEVQLEITRSGHVLPITLRLTKKDISPVEHRLLDGNIGYIFVRWFARSQDAEHDTAALFLRALATFTTRGATGLIIDLRSAIGGSGEVKIVSALCDGDMIYAVKKPRDDKSTVVKREGPRIWGRQPIVILINQNTVSAGEDLALSLRELGHATIIGKTSGGGLTEFSVIPLAADYGMTIPTDIVVGPLTGTDQPNHAVKPDVEIANPSVEELTRGVDLQLDAARDELERKR